MLNNFFKDKRIFITGGTGFKGSWLSVWFLKIGAYVKNYSLYNSFENSHFDLLNLQKTLWFEHETGDIRDLKKLRESIEIFQPDIIVHTAAQALVIPSYVDRLYTFDVNIMGVANIFEACLNIKSIKVILNVVTDKVFKIEDGNNYYKSDDKLGGNDPYSSSKACSEILSQCYRKSFPTQLGKIVTAFSGNCIGGGDFGEFRIIPDLVKNASKDESTEIRNPFAIRPFLHVLNTLWGYLLLIKKVYEEDGFDRAWNFGPMKEDHMTISDIVTLCKQHWSKIKTIPAEYASFMETSLLQLDVQETIDKLNWKPIWNTIESVEKTIKWYREYYETGNILTYQQIEDFEKCIKNN